jgi:hypothetical protein
MVAHQAELTSRGDKMKGTDALGLIVGEPLTAVSFVMDYLTFQFNQPILTVLSPVTLTVGDRLLPDSDPNFAQALRSQIGKVVTEARVRIGHEILIVFGDNSRLSASLKPGISDSGEFALLQKPPDGFWVWRDEIDNN